MKKKLKFVQGLIIVLLDILVSLSVMAGGVYYIIQIFFSFIDLFSLLFKSNRQGENTAIVFLVFIVFLALFTLMSDSLNLELETVRSFSIIMILLSLLIYPIIYLIITRKIFKILIFAGFGILFSIIRSIFIYFIEDDYNKKDKDEEKNTET